MYPRINPNSCLKCGGIVRVFCPMQKGSVPCVSVNHQTEQKDRQDQSHPHSYQSLVKESLQIH